VCGAAHAAPVLSTVWEKGFIDDGSYRLIMKKANNSLTIAVFFGRVMCVGLMVLLHGRLTHWRNMPRLLYFLGVFLY
jgi:hypothetical protein